MPKFNRCDLTRKEALVLKNNDIQLQSKTKQRQVWLKISEAIQFLRNRQVGKTLFWKVTKGLQIPGKRSPVYTVNKKH